MPDSSNLNDASVDQDRMLVNLLLGGCALRMLNKFVIPLLR